MNELTVRLICSNCERTLLKKVNAISQIGLILFKSSKRKKNLLSVLLGLAFVYVCVSECIFSWTMFPEEVKLNHGGCKATIGGKLTVSIVVD